MRIMALVQVKRAFRAGLVQRISCYASPPQPSSPLSETHSMSGMHRKNLVLAQQVSTCKRMFFTTPSTAAEAGSGSAHGVDPTQEEVGTAQSSLTGFSSVSDPDLLDRTYGQQQKDHRKVADASHDHFANTVDEREGMDETGFDISKVSKPAGDE